MDILGGRSMLVVLREILLGVTKFDDIVANTGAARDVVSRRLRELEEAGLVQRVRYSDHVKRFEYVPTESGDALFAMLQLLRAWGDEFAREPGDTRVARYQHSCGQRLYPKVVCRACDGEVTAESVSLIRDYRASDAA
ncbi:helix-turn-helix domain-containing protein [Leifsonia sp. NPDC077715]|uniref:winged helix-turn-helix transcriptional regulator n=1 Tax=Leifsonia sp. NPDC077715 TaxID=3155539 RepID=UPI00341C354A